MDAQSQAALLLLGLSVLAGAMVIIWCISTDSRYMDTWRKDDE